MAETVIVPAIVSGGRGEYWSVDGEHVISRLLHWRGVGPFKGWALLRCVNGPALVDSSDTKLGCQIILAAHVACRSGALTPAERDRECARWSNRERSNG